ncbi:nitrous oxide reductase family maturation protein NosD [Rubrivivax sp. A210]|uniref:right-handed parallel beta-helix repeat-containing protein n=1 Tax=Rubrivivax sp. A210 TaxID=2772301 RepID=UPI001917DF74|nr:right-handed parallel beta-helix repeat-containing protein [Rubrivivax sp. A210]
MLLLLAQAVGAETWVVGPKGEPRSLVDALAQAQDGDTIELMPGDYSPGLVLENRKLTLRGLGTKPRIVGNGKVGASKALWLVRGGEVTLENIAFLGARANDGEGAGLRMEGGRLLLKGCVFQDNEYGVYAANDDSAELTVANSEFGKAPHVVGGLYHLLNVGRIARLSVSGSRFQQGFEGHLLKTRARENVISYNFIHDGRRGGASYEIDIANGGLATVIGNVIGQGADSQNPVLVAYGAEGRAWDQNRLLVSHNTFVSYGWMPAWFLRVFGDRLPENTEIIAINNLLVGGGLFSLANPGSFEGNRPATLGMLRDAETYAFELAPGSMWRTSGVDPRKFKGHDLAPKAEFEWPTGMRPLAGERTSWAPGAYQR